MQYFISVYFTFLGSFLLQLKRSEIEKYLVHQFNDFENPKIKNPGKILKIHHQNLQKPKPSKTSL